MFPGLSKPVLYLNKTDFAEGDVVTATCTAPGETGSMYFKFYMESKEIYEGDPYQTNHKMLTFPVKAIGRHKIHCAYTVSGLPHSIVSEDSDTIFLSVSGTSILKLFSFII